MITFDTPTKTRPQELTHYDAANIARTLLEAARCPDAEFYAKTYGADGSETSVISKSKGGQEDNGLSQIYHAERLENGQLASVRGETGEWGFYFANFRGDIPVSLSGTFKQDANGPTQEGTSYKQGNGILYVEGNVGRFRIEGNTTKRGVLIVNANPEL